MKIKKCTKCKKDKLFSEFYKNKRKPNGLESRCKSCITEDRKIKIDKISAYHRQWYLDNKEKKDKQNLDNYYKNREARLLYAKIRNENPEIKKRKSVIEKKRNEVYRLTPRRRFSHYKGAAKAKGRIFDISFKYFMQFWQKSCIYCGTEISTIGLDRINSKEGYIAGNIQPCCILCNRIKSNLTIQEFNNFIFNISKNFDTINWNREYNVKDIDTRVSNRKYSSYKYSAKRCRNEFRLSKLDFFSFYNKECVYCGSKIDGIGIDRVDNNIGYIYNNCVPCCKHCNWAKSNLLLKDFIEHINKIITFNT